MLPETVLSQVEAAFANIVEDVEIVRRLDASSQATHLASLLDQLASRSPRVFIRDEPATGGRAPSCTVQRRASPSVSVEFAGVPLGHELSSLVLAVVHAGGHRPVVDDGALGTIASIDRDLRFETYYSTSCQNCPEVVQAINLMAMHNPRIHHVAIDGSAFPDEVRERNITAVPAVFCNGAEFLQGRADLTSILARIAPDAAATEKRRIEALAPFDLVVVGGGPAGAAAAVYAARKGIATCLVAERIGGQVQDTAGIENLVSVLHTEGPQLAADLAAHVAAYDVTVLAGQRAERLEPARPGGLHRLVLASGAAVEARAVVLAPGASWRTLNVPGEDRLRNRGVTFCPHCDGPLFKGRPVAVVGGGNSGVEAAIDLAGVASHVTILEYGDRMRADAVLLRALSSLDNVTVVTGATATEIRGDSTVEGLDYRDVASGEVRRIDVAGVFVQIGLVPATGWIGDVVDCNSSGEIIVDDRGTTSIPGVFAAGDATTAPFKQIVVALGSGATAALSAFDYVVRTRPSARAAD